MTQKNETPTETKAKPETKAVPETKTATKTVPEKPIPAPEKPIAVPSSENPVKTPETSDIKPDASEPSPAPIEQANANSSTKSRPGDLSPELMELVTELRDTVKRIDPRRHTAKTLRRSLSNVSDILADIDKLYPES